MAFLLLSYPERGAIWRRVFHEAGEDLWVGTDEVRDAAAVTHLACWQPPDLSAYPNLRVLLSVGAGVDHMPPLPPGVALVRTVAPGIDRMVRDWVVMGTLMLHRDMPAYLDAARQGRWCQRPVRLAGSRRVGIMGMGRIGRLAAETLAGLGFEVAGWSRSGTPVPGIEIHGAAGLDAFLARTDILICLLPLTGSTRGILNAGLFAKLPQGAHLVHAGRGAQLDMAALSGALDAGRLASAMLDVTAPEPLPADHPAWADPRIVITPHVAANTDPEEGARHALAVLMAWRAGQTLPGLVDPEAGY
ncbi:2-hydroxyacid dehydrogenase [Rhodovulum visakhapatnamense]|uniref:Glyoxylate/hydroxypyruvate reductase A n=1 Tax=Rhodovulum visakhapatnamense TaxID=364297 RepID=A0A4R8FJ25_9RHOB|nr:glyoxylate/hydroxypyruvate reductase A [Rhodovulum visakhapatnamense]TDX26109.1 glyoxylate/hydroxypyruvate reductase A [Rhodovulum visakhapatnamense]